MSVDLYIIAAGKGSRMGGTLPKALVPINEDEPNITTTLKQIGSKFRHVFIVVNELVIAEWRKYTDTYGSQPFMANVTMMPISSGLGDGHAVLMALMGSEPGVWKDFTPTEELVVLWGDAFIQHAETVDEMLSKQLCAKSASGLIPAVMEQNPYVTLLTDGGNKIISADFSKYGENHSSGWHDQSIFYFKREPLLNALHALNNSLWKNGRYMTQGGELSMLYAFHYLFNSNEGAVVYETDYPTLSFNTPEEVVSIQKEIQEKWNMLQSS